jgi:hypothetical protein
MEEEGTRRMTRPPRHTHTFTASTLAGAVTGAIAFIVLANEERSSAHASTLVFTGEGASPEAALREALDDIRAQCVDHRCTPIDVATDGVMSTDTGTRIWGTLSCTPGTTAALPPTEILEFATVREGSQWTLTVTRR